MPPGIGRGQRLPPQLAPETAGAPLRVKHGVFVVVGVFVLHHHVQLSVSFMSKPRVQGQFVSVRPFGPFGSAMWEAWVKRHTRGGKTEEITCLLGS